ncbi:DUF2306 domain-containing protein [Parvularcula bermudensis]|nr:DUF2306 domain-containing protein [Parvularcula bermudensis]
MAGQVLARYRIAPKAALSALLLIGLYEVWRVVFYILGYSAATPPTSFPLINDTAKALDVMATHPNLILYTHGLCGVAAVTIGAVQIYALWTGQVRRWHALLGRGYIAACLMGAATAFILAWHLYYTFWLTSLLYTLGALAWGGAAVLAVTYIVKGDVMAHARWVIRSYVYLMMVVTARALIGATIGFGLNRWAQFEWPLAYGIIIGVTFIVHLVAAEVIVRRLRLVRPIRAGSTLLTEEVSSVASGVPSSPAPH